MNSTKLFLISSCVFLMFGCSDDKFSPGVFEGIAKVLIEDEQYSIQYLENDEEVNFIVEDLLNVSDNIGVTTPNIDFLRIMVDINNNNQLDSLLDVQYSISSISEPCQSFLLTESSITGCGSEEGFTVNSLFAASDKNSEAHVIHEFVIRKDFLFANSETVGLIFILQGSQSAGAIPSFLSPTFSETITFSL